MEEQTHIAIRRLRPGDALYLMDFYNGLSEESIRTFHPLGLKTSLDVCTGIVEENSPEKDTGFDLAAWYGNLIIGWAFLWDLSSGTPSLGLGVADSFQGKGIGRKLMELVMDTAKMRGVHKVLLTVVKDNKRAKRLYEKQGFVIYGEYFDEKDDLLYWRMAAQIRRK